MDLHEAVTLRDRERLKDRDREFPKRRRIERYAMQQKNGGVGYRENESTDDESDEEYREDEADTRIHFPDRLNHPSLQSSSIPNNRRNLRTLRSSPVLRASVDETIGVPIPRRARSTSLKRLHDYRNLSSGKSGEDLSHRRFSSSPATASHICAGGASPSASGASIRKKMKSIESRARALKSTSNPRPSSEIEDDIEIEVVEALFDLMKQSQSLSKSKFDKDSVNAADEGSTKGGKDENKTFLLQHGKSIKLDPETAVDDSMGEMKEVEGIEKEKFPNDSAPQHGDGFFNIEKVLSPKESESPSCVKVDVYEVQDPKATRADDTTIVVETKTEAKIEIDLMVPPPVTSSTGKDVLDDMATFPEYMAHDVQRRETISEDGHVEAINRFPKVDLEKHYHDKSIVREGGKQQLRSQKEQENQLQTSLSPFQISLGGWPGVLPHTGYMQSQQAVLPMDDSARFRIAMQPPKFRFSQLRPKRSATHQYIACSIQQHQQHTTKALWSGPTGGVTLMPPTQKSTPGIPANGECQGERNLGAIAVGCGKDKSSKAPLSLNSTKNTELMLQQASFHTAKNFPHNPAFIFPLGHHQRTAMAPAKSSVPAQSASASGNMSLLSDSTGRPSENLSLPGKEAVTSFSGPSLTSNEVAPFMAVLQNNGCQYPISTSMVMPQLKGVPSPPLPLFNSALYSSTLFGVAQSQMLTNAKTVDNNYRSLAAAHSTQTEKQQFPPSHSSSKTASEIGRKASALYSNTQQRSTENRVELIPQSFSASFGLNAPSCPPLNLSSIAQSSAIFPVLPDMAWNGYEMAKPKNLLASDGKGATGSTKIEDGLKRTLGKLETHGRKSSSNDVLPVSMKGTSIVDGLAGSVNLVPSMTSGNQQPFPPSSVAQTSGVSPNLHHHQQQSIQLQKHYMQQMQQTGTANINVSTGPGKFYISNQCVSGNPSSHKGWMSRYFFIKRISSRENPWGCDMSWRDNAYTQPPSTPEPAPELTDFLKVTREKCFNAQELIEEDLMCHFKFSGKEVPLVGDLGERMSKVEMLRALNERKADPKGTSRSLSKGKMKGAEERGEKRKKRQHEQGTHESGREPVPKEAIKETSTSGGKVPEQTTEASYEYLDASTISFIAKPSGSTSLDFTRRLIPDRDYNLVNSVPDLAALEASSLHLMQAVVWSGSVANSLFRAREEITKTKHSMDGVIQEHEGLMKQLEEIQVTHDKENEEMALELESSRT
ncbi:Time for coffee isoform 1 [Dorcoceras hygrometricum]|uniref:Time for coffee isoform 1 n=1 Tax=Dorcoceras hygrometricum TaxID=472368 RepID=A0A2Z7AMC0_9LAMI|nr:Time for coffee isoform 1 [Dorcoceras hygrometricum]